MTMRVVRLETLSYPIPISFMRLIRKSCTSPSWRSLASSSSIFDISSSRARAVSTSSTAPHLVQNLETMEFNRPHRTHVLGSNLISASSSSAFIPYIFRSALSTSLPQRCTYEIVLGEVGITLSNCRTPLWNATKEFMRQESFRRTYFYIWECTMHGSAEDYS